MSATANLSEFVQLFDGELVLQKNIFGALNVREEFTKQITWDARRFRLKRAILFIEARQTVTSGAELRVSWNGKPLNSRIEWNAFETSSKSLSEPITLRNGDNSVDLTYEVTAAHQFAAECYILGGQVRLTFEALSPSAGGKPTRDRFATDDNKLSKDLDNVFVSVRNNAIIIIAVIAVVIGLLAVLDKVIFRRLGGIWGAIRGLRK